MRVLSTYSFIRVLLDDLGELLFERLRSVPAAGILKFGQVIGKLDRLRSLCSAFLCRF